MSSAALPRVLFVVEGHTDIRFVTGLATICELTLLVATVAFRASGLDNRMREAGLRVPVRELPGGRLAFQGRSFVWLWRHAQEFDVVLSQELLRGTLSANLACSLRGVPVVASVLVPAIEYFRCRRERRQIGPLKAWAGETLMRWLMTVNGRLVTRCVAWGPYLQTVAARYCARVEPGHYYGVDTDYFRPADLPERQALRRRHGLPVDRFLILFPSRVSHEKDPETVLRATARLRERGVDAVVLNLGGGYEDFLRLAAELKLTGASEWVLGRPAMHPMRELADFFRSADVICQASLEEGLSLATLEGLACGVPVVASSVGGMAVRLRDHALLTARRDAEKMADAFEQVARDPAAAQVQA
ncbi:MAG TPA: glycosyltransferase family 4 protein, partial [Candidatus Limnocylindria bacterium]|nr:glycosyltransferase family 4 protein [Candidatus Limnocylindria bacterium]